MVRSIAGPRQRKTHACMINKLLWTVPRLFASVHGVSRGISNITERIPNGFFISAERFRAHRDCALGLQSWSTIAESSKAWPSILGVSITIIFVSSTFDDILRPGWAVGKTTVEEWLSRAICRSGHHRSAGVRTAVILSLIGATQDN